MLIYLIAITVAISIAVIFGLFWGFGLYLIAIAVAAFITVNYVLFWRFGRQNTLNVYRSKYQRLLDDGYSEGECLFRLLSTRPGWESLPQPILRELSERLGNWENIADFIHFSESESLERDQYARIAQADPDMQAPDVAMRAVALALRPTFPSIPKARGTMLRLGKLIAPDDGIIGLNGTTTPDDR